MGFLGGIMGRTGPYWLGWVSRSSPHFFVADSVGMLGFSFITKGCGVLLGRGWARWVSLDTLFWRAWVLVKEEDSARVHDGGTGIPAGKGFMTLGTQHNDRSGCWRWERGLSAYNTPLFLLLFSFVLS